MRISLYLYLVLVLCLAGCGASSTTSTTVPSSEEGEAAGPSRLIAQWAYVDGVNKLIYVTTEDQTIDAIDIMTGTVRWSSSAAAMPLRVVGDHLLALTLGNPFQLVNLDPMTGELQERCNPIALPEWANVAARDGLGTQFRVEMQERGASTYLAWSAHTHYVGGVAPSPEQMEAARHDADGVVEVDVATCRAREATDASTQAQAAPAAELIVDGISITTTSGTNATTLVVARDAQSQEARWTRALPATMYLGPYPP